MFSQFFLISSIIVGLLDRITISFVIIITTAIIIIIIIIILHVHRQYRVIQVWVFIMHAVNEAHLQLIVAVVFRFLLPVLLLKTNSPTSNISDTVISVIGLFNHQPNWGSVACTNGREWQTKKRTMEITHGTITAICNWYNCFTKCYCTETIYRFTILKLRP